MKTKSEPKIVKPVVKIKIVSRKEESELKDFLEVSPNPKCTYDYSQFFFSNVNRNPYDKRGQQHIEKLKVSFLRRPEMLPHNPILVYPNGLIPDGQHTFIACMELGLPIYYHVIPHEKDGDMLSTMITMNSSTLLWTIENYIHAYAEYGYKQYEGYYEFAEKVKEEVGKVPAGVIQSMYFLNDCPSNIIKDYEKASRIEVNPLRDECKKWIKFCKDNGIMLYKTCQFVYALKEFIVDKSYNDISGVLKRVANEWEVWNCGAQKKAYLSRLNAVYVSYLKGCNSIKVA